MYVQESLDFQELCFRGNPSLRSNQFPAGNFFVFNLSLSLSLSLSERFLKENPGRIKMKRVSIDMRE